MSFFAKVYALTRLIPPGHVTTYGVLASALSSRDARRVGHALHANRDPLTPCHRVVNQVGRLAPNFAFGGSSAQYALLKNEGVTFLDREHVNLAKHFWDPPILPDSRP